MALTWFLDRKQYGPDGLVTLFRGDDWALYGQIVDLVNGYKGFVDTTTFLGATGYFPSATGGPDLPAGAEPSLNGIITVSMPAASTPNVEVSTGGMGPYIVVEMPNNTLQTIQTPDQPLAIIDRMFST